MCIKIQSIPTYYIYISSAFGDATDVLQDIEGISAMTQASQTFLLVDNSNLPFPGSIVKLLPWWRKWINLEVMPKGLQQRRV